MLRITKERENGKGVTLKLEGKIANQWAALLEGECRLLLRQNKVLALDVAGVDYIDESGLEVIRNLPDQVRISKAPGFIKEILRAGGRP
jgi:anti-anti-sigma regulatory factor